MNWTAADHAWMSRALMLARRGLETTTPNPRVGCVLVRAGVEVGAGWHERAGEPHAEIHALAVAAEKARGATCYVTLEPCSHHGRTPPCSDALIRAGVTRVVAAMQDPNPRVAGRGLAALVAAGIDVETGLFTQAAHELNAGFCRRMRGAGPRVRCKLAVSLDGRTAAADGDAKWVTSAAAREDVMRLRAQSCAILTGAGTVSVDDPRLDVRNGNAETRQPLRVILDRRLRCPPAARILRAPGRALVMAGAGAVESAAGRALAQAGAEVVAVPGQDEAFLSAALQWLATEREINEVLLEAGPTLSGAMVRAGLVQELIVYQAPVLLGSRGLPMLDLPGQRDMGAARRLKLVESRRVGPDYRHVYVFGE